MDFLADYVVLLPVVMLVVLIVPTGLVVGVGMWLDEKHEDGWVGAAFLLAGMVTGIASVVASIWLAWRVLMARDGWFSGHPVWTVAIVTAVLLLGVAVLGAQERNDEMAFWQLAEFADEFTDDEIATMPKKHQDMVWRIRAMTAQEGSAG